MFKEPYFPLIVAATTLSVMFIFFLTVLLIALRRRMNTKNRLFSQSLVEERDRTMSIISMEIHDNVNQMLNVVRLNVHWLLDNADVTAKQVEHLETIGDIIDTLILDTNNISHTLNNQYLERNGLILVLKEEVAWVEAAKKVKCTLEISGITKKLEPKAELMIFRIAQEALNNCVKHADCTHIEINLAYESWGLLLSIRDNGKGFMIQPDDYKNGIGLSNMLSRAGVLNANLDITSNPGSGTEVTLLIGSKELEILYAKEQQQENIPVVIE